MKTEKRSLSKLVDVMDDPIIKSERNDLFKLFLKHTKSLMSEALEDMLTLAFNSGFAAGFTTAASHAARKESTDE